MGSFELGLFSSSSVFSIVKMVNITVLFDYDYDYDEDEDEAVREDAVVNVVLNCLCVRHENLQGQPGTKDSRACNLRLQDH